MQFGRDELRKEIYDRWGEYGAHAEVYRDLEVEVERLRSQLAELKEVLLLLDKSPRFRDSHSPYYTFNEDTMRDIRAALSQMRNSSV